MPRVLLYTGPPPGHVYPPVATALALRDRGHEVSVRTAAGSVAQFEELGLDAAPIDPRIEALPAEDWRGRTPIGAIRRLFETFDRRAGHEVPDMRAAIEAERPDLIWVDINATGAAAAAEASGIPWAHYMPYPYALPGKGIPPFGPGFAPAAGLPGRVRDAATAATKRLAYRSATAKLNARRAALGLPALGSYEDLGLTAPLLIEFSAEPFEYARTDWPANVRLVGPALWEPPAAEPAWLAREERPIVLASASTEFQDDAKLIRVALEALADEPYALVVTTAAHDPADFRVPANARVERFLPHGPILGRATAVITHGGMGTTQKALAAGVPVCVVPFMRDQFEVARRVGHCRAGAVVTPWRLRPERLRVAVEEAIGCRPAAERVRDAFAAAGGASAAADALEDLIGARTGAALGS